MLGAFSVGPWRGHVVCNKSKGSNMELTKQDYGTIVFALENYLKQLQNEGGTFSRLYELIWYFDWERK